MAKAIYYSEIFEPKAFDVIKDNKDGTVDIGTGKLVVVSKAKVVKDPAVGCVESVAVTGIKGTVVTTYSFLIVAVSGTS